MGGVIFANGLISPVAAHGKNRDAAINSFQPLGFPEKFLTVLSRWLYLL